MTTGLVIISHDSVGQSLVDAAATILGMCPMALELVSVSPGCDPDDVIERARTAVRRINQGDGVLILTDMYGSTPSNVANRLAPEADIRVVAGLNLPMLIRVFNYPGMSLAELAQKAGSGGRDGIFICEADSCDIPKD